MDFNNLIPELSVFDILQTKKFYKELGFKIEYERQKEKFIFMSFQDSQFMFEQIHDEGVEHRRIKLSIGKRYKFFNSSRRC